MKLTTTTLALAALSASAAAQTGLRVDVTSGGASTVLVGPGDTVFYSVTGQIVGGASSGLAMFAFDLVFDGGDLTPLAPPATGPLLQFVAPAGFNNPAGYGGTLEAGDLLQVGGAMNTIANQFAPTPNGVVVPGVAAAVAEELGTGSLVAPQAAGVYTLTVENVFANALDAQQSVGWSVTPLEAAEPGDLTVVVLDCGAQTFCTGKASAAGCVPTIAASGAASLGGASTLTLTADDAPNGQLGLFAYGTEAASSPGFGGTICVGGNVVRSVEPGTSGGSGAPGSSCTGEFVRVIDAAFLGSAGFGIGDTVVCQWWIRDPQNPDGSGACLSDAAAFVVCP